MKALTDIISRGLVVSCQAPKGDPLHGSVFMKQMAVAAVQGGAVSVRADGPEDIRAIRQCVEIPIIGVNKNTYPSSPVYITPTFEDAREIVWAGADVVGLDATERHRPGGGNLAMLIERIHVELDVPVVADIAIVREGVRAVQAGADALASTLSGYVEGSPEIPGPDFKLVGSLVESVSVPIFAEGRYRTPEDVEKAIDIGAYAVVVGTAITRPHVMTEIFASAVKARIK